MIASLAEANDLEDIIDSCIFATKRIKLMEKDNVIVMDAEDTYSDLFWNEDGTGIGDYDSLFIGNNEYSTSSIVGLKEWFMQADKYDPFTSVTEFTTEGMEEWINQGYEFAKQLLTIIPKDIKLYYGYWHQFGDGKWRWCKAYISNYEHHQE